MSHDEKWILLLILASLPADSIPDDPCLIHTVLDQPWRSTDCTTGACIQDVQDDSTLTEEWYRFRSSGGWMIPETVAPNGGCSGYSAGWLNGAHPRVGDGEVTRKVCFNWNGELCIKPLDVKIKACAGFFVYRLKPTGCCGIVYCTDPASVRKPEYFDTTTKDSLENFSTASDASSGINIGVVGQGSSPKVTNQWAKDPPTDTTQEPQGATAADFGQGLTGDTAVSASSDGASLRRREYSDTTTEPQEHFSTGPDACSDGACKKTVETADSPPKRCCEAQSTSDGGPHAFKKEKAKGSAQQQSSVPAGGTTSDPQKSTEEQTTGSVIGESTQGPSSVPAGDTSTDGASGTAQGTADQRSARIGISDLHSTSDQARATGTAPRAVGLPSTRNELSDSQATSNEDPQKSTEEQTAGSIIGESTQGPSSVPVEDTSADSQASTGKRAQGTLTGESTQGQSSAPAGDSSSASPGTAHGTTERRSTRMSISDIRSSSGEDEEFQWIQIQVTSKGGVSEEEVKQALREKLQEMFDDPDPQIERVFSDDESWDN